MIGSHARLTSGDISSCSASRAESLVCRGPPLRPSVALTFVKPTPGSGVLVASASYLSPTTTLNRPSFSLPPAFPPSSSFHPLCRHSPSISIGFTISPSLPSLLLSCCHLRHLCSPSLSLPPPAQRVLHPLCLASLFLFRPFVRELTSGGSIFSTCRCLSVRATARISRRTFTIALKPLRILSLSTHACSPPSPVSLYLASASSLEHPSPPLWDPCVSPSSVRRFSPLPLLTIAHFSSPPLPPRRGNGQSCSSDSGLRLLFDPPPLAYLHHRANSHLLYLSGVKNTAR